MYNWNTDIKKLSKDKEKYAIWRLEQAINFGLNSEKLDKKMLIKYWPRLDIDPSKKIYLKFLLWKKRS